MPFKDEVTRKAYHKKYHAKWYEENKNKRHAQIVEYEKEELGTRTCLRLTPPK